MRFCQQVITITPELHQVLIDRGLSPAKVNYLPNGIDVDVYNFKKNTRKTILTELKIPSDVTVIGTACRLQLIKNIPMLLKTAKRLIVYQENVRFVIVGDGTERQMLEDMAAQLQITEYVKFVGWRTDAPRLMSAFDIFALTSKDEGMPIAVLEAMALGKAVVGTNVGAMNECVLHGQTGLLVPSGDVNKMTEFLQLLIRDKNRAFRLGQAGRALVKQKFSKEIMVQKTLDVYAAAIDSKLASSQY
jgi:glycosyltransferase involved in cell wall biosynthesis